MPRYKTLQVHSSVIIVEKKLIINGQVHEEVHKGSLSFFFGSLQLVVAKMNGRAGAKKTYDSGELLGPADAPYKRCVCQRNASV